MPDRRRHRGPHPEDQRLFASKHHANLRLATSEYSWLLTRSYAVDAALKIVGDHHGLTARQRLAVRRSACSDQSLAERTRKHVSTDSLSGRRLAVDGYNLLITIESALSGGLVLVGRDGCLRDLASLHGTYRKVQETVPAIELTARAMPTLGVDGVTWFLDRPVSNSGRLRALMDETFERMLSLPSRAPTSGQSADVCRSWTIELVPKPDKVLSDHTDVVVTSDSVILDRCRAWTNLAELIVKNWIERAWVVNLRSDPTVA